MLVADMLLPDLVIQILAPAEDYLCLLQFVLSNLMSG